MPEPTPSTQSRGFSKADALRTLSILPLLAVIAGCYWVVLPAIQSLILPEAPGGESGAWIVRPILALRFGAMAIMAAVTMPYVLRPLRKLWDRQDADKGSRYTPLKGRPIKRFFIILQGTLLIGIYGLALAFYLFSWTNIDTDGIKQRLPWTTLHHSYQEIAALEMIPDGERIDAFDQNGPHYSIRLKSGRTITLGLDNEGLGKAELQSMTNDIAERAGLEWQRRKGSRPR